MRDRGFRGRGSYVIATELDLLNCRNIWPKCLEKAADVQMVSVYDLRKSIKEDDDSIDASQAFTELH